MQAALQMPSMKVRDKASERSQVSYRPNLRFVPREQGHCAAMPESTGQNFGYKLQGSSGVSLTGGVPSARVLTVPCEIDGRVVTAIAARAFENRRDIEEVRLPATVQIIGEAAFRGCMNLKRVVMGEGVVEIEDDAFALCPSLGVLELPSGIERIGANITGAHNDLMGIGHARICVPSGCTDILQTPDGAIYQRQDDGLVLADASQVDATLLAVDGRCAAIAPRACAQLASMERVVLPEGLRIIGKEAFRGCRKLAVVELPDTLVSIGAAAFSCTALEQLNIPASCVDLAEDALTLGPVVAGGVRNAYLSSFASCEVASGNPRYRSFGGLVCGPAKTRSGKWRALACVRSAEEVLVPDDVAELAPGALAGTTRIGTLSVPQHLSWPHGECLAAHGTCATLVVRLQSAQGEAQSLVLEMPDGAFSRDLFKRTLCSGCIDAKALASAYDAGLAHIDDAYVRTKLMLARLARPVMLDDALADEFKREVGQLFDPLCVDFGRKGLWRFFDMLADAALLVAGNVSHVADLLAKHADALAVGYVLDLKRRRFGEAALDYGI